MFYSKDARKSLAEEHPGINNSTLTAHISLKWKVYNNIIPDEGV